jgi:hypothetical protein
MKAVDDETMRRITDYIEHTTNLLWRMRVFVPLVGAAGLLAGFLFGRITLVCP